MFENNTFDVIISLAVIEHLDDPSIFLREIYRVLKNNGILFLSTPNWHYSKENFMMISLIRNHIHQSQLVTC